MHIDCDTCPGRPRACDGCVMTLLTSPRDALASANSEVHCGESTIDHELRIGAAAELFRAAGMLDDAPVTSHGARNTLPRRLIALSDPGVRRAG